MAARTLLFCGCNMPFCLLCNVCFVFTCIAPMVELDSQPTNRNNELMAELERRKKVCNRNSISHMWYLSTWITCNLCIDKICCGASRWSWSEDWIKITWTTCLWVVHHTNIQTYRHTRVLARTRTHTRMCVCVMRWQLYVMYCMKRIRKCKESSEYHL